MDSSASSFSWLSSNSNSDIFYSSLTWDSVIGAAYPEIIGAIGDYFLSMYASNIRFAWIFLWYQPPGLLRFVLLHVNCCFYFYSWLRFGVFLIAFLVPTYVEGFWEEELRWYRWEMSNDWLTAVQTEVDFSNIMFSSSFHELPTVIWLPLWFILAFLENDDVKSFDNKFPATFDFAWVRSWCSYLLKLLK